MQVEQMMIAACNACQLRCEHCAHRGMRASDPAYQMPIEDIGILLRRLETIDCRVGIFMFNGPGEPLLWRHFNEAMHMIYRSGIADQIKVFTNGIRLDAIDADVWPMLEKVYISTYGQELDQDIIDRYEKTIDYSAGETFWALDESKLPAASVSGCMCQGPMYYKRTIFPHCGPPMFAAAELIELAFPLRVNPFALGGASPIEQWSPDNQPRINLPCRWCWANGATSKITVSNP
jgi:hypothetical protein